MLVYTCFPTGMLGTGTGPNFCRKKERWDMCVDPSRSSLLLLLCSVASTCLDDDDGDGSLLPIMGSGSSPGTDRHGPADEQSGQKSLWNFVTANHPVVLGVVFDHLSSIEGLPHEAFVFLANCNEKRRRKTEWNWLPLGIIIYHQFVPSSDSGGEGLISAVRHMDHCFLREDALRMGWGWIRWKYVIMTALYR